MIKNKDESKPLKIVVTGPECSGKSSISSLLCQQLNWPLVSEFAREYLSKDHIDYQYEDVLKIAEGQIKKERSALSRNVKGIICDTNILTIIVWLELKFGRVPNELYEVYCKDPVDLYLLCKPDFEFELDPWREDSTGRDMIFDYYLSRLLKDQQSFAILAGRPEDRLKSALQYVAELSEGK